MLFPESRGIIGSHDEEGSGEGICERSVRADDRHRGESALSRISGARINDMVIMDSVFLKIALISTGSDD